MSTPSNSAAQISVDPAERMLPSNASIGASICHASVRQTPGARASPSLTALRSTRPMTEEPVPCVALTGPGAKAPWANRAEWELAITAPTATPSGSGASPRAAGNGPVDATTLRHGGKGHVEDRQQAPRPSARFDHVEQLRARGVAGLDRPPRRRSATGETRRSCRCRSRPPLRGPVPWEAIEQPAGLGGGEHRVERQAALASDDAAVAGGAQGGADALRALVLPRQDRRQRLRRCGDPR